ncbi:MAG: nuclear transport factor 2 family protein [Pseudomonadota bacterium]
MNGYEDHSGVSQAQAEEIIKLEESLWVAETRYDDAYMETLLAPDFLEFGKSGKTYTRDKMFFGGFNGQKIDCKLPLTGLQIRAVGTEITQTLYVSELKRNGITERANRSSIWRRTIDGNWQILFHQGTETKE